MPVLKVWLRVEGVKRMILARLALCDGYVTGEKLVEEVGVSRDVVDVAVEWLRREGYPVEAHPVLGYRLVFSDDLREAVRYLSLLGGKLSFAVHFLESCTSTQDIAADLARRGAPEGTIVLAEEQKGGRGRLNRAWVSPRGGLWFTLVLRSVQIEIVGLVSLALGVAVAKAVRGLYGVDAKLKWPNDVLVGGKKLAGVLVESIVEGSEVCFLLAGVGINVNNELLPPVCESATSIRELLGNPVPRVPLLLRTLKEIDTVYAQLHSGLRDVVLNEWRALSVTLGRPVCVDTHDGKYEGLAVDVDCSGGLIVEMDGRRVTFYYGDVVHLR